MLRSFAIFRIFFFFCSRKCIFARTFARFFFYLSLITFSISFLTTTMMSNTASFIVSIVTDPTEKKMRQMRRNKVHFLGISSSSEKSSNWLDIFHIGKSDSRKVYSSWRTFKGQFAFCIKYNRKSWMKMDKMIFKREMEIFNACMDKINFVSLQLNLFLLRSLDSANWTGLSLIMERNGKELARNWNVIFFFTESPLGNRIHSTQTESNVRYLTEGRVKKQKCNGKKWKCEKNVCM